MILTYFNVSFSFFLHSWAWAGSRAQECKKNEKDTLKYDMKYDKLN